MTKSRQGRARTIWQDWTAAMPHPEHSATSAPALFVRAFDPDRYWSQR